MFDHALFRSPYSLVVYRPFFFLEKIEKLDKL